jgi:general secretion pathway protein D
MPDTPYLRVYQIDYVNMERDTTSAVGTSTQVATPGATGGGGGGGNQSSTSITSKSTNHFWETLVKNVQDILHETDKILPAPGQAGAAAAPAQPSATFREAASVIANPESGVLFIRATSRQHEKIQGFLDQVLTNAKRQVLIEATIAEVQLNNQYQQGIDWSAGRFGSTGFIFNQFAGGDPVANGPTAASPTGNAFVIRAAAPNYSNLSATVKLLESYGNVRVLSSPRLTVLNNQTAILKVVKSQVYFTTQASTTSTANVGTIQSVTTTPNIVAIGLIMNVTPQISDSDTVLLNVRPSISSIVDNIRDPNPALVLPSNIPVIQTREMESLIKVNSGQIAVMGGLIEDAVTDNQDSVPGASRLAGYGGFFGNRNQINTKTELVVFIRPVIIRDASMNGDYRGYRSFLPNDKFLAAPNPGKPPLLGDPQGKSQ